MLYVCFFTVTGIVQIINYFTNKNAGASGWLLALGILDVVLGLYLLTHALALFTFIPFLVAFWAVFVGAGRIGLAFTVKKAGGSWGLILAAGIAMIILGIMMFSAPLASILSVAVLFAVGMFVLAIDSLVEAFTN